MTGGLKVRSQAFQSTALRPLGYAAIVLATVTASLLGVGQNVALAGEVNAHGAQHPVGFSEMAAKVKAAVIGVRVKVESPQTDLSDQDLPFPPGSPFYKFFGAPDQRQKRRF